MKSSQGKLFASILMLLSALSGSAGVTETNAAEYAEWEAGALALQEVSKGEVAANSQSLAILATMGIEYDKMSTWSRQYTKYLSEAKGYASAVAAFSTIAAEAADMAMTVYQLCMAVKRNPDGLVSSAALSRVYVNLIQEMISVNAVYKNLLDTNKNATESKQMLTGPERSRALWTIVDMLRSLKKRLKQVGLAVTYFNLADIRDSILNPALNNINRNDIKGMHRRAAKEALGRWLRCPTAAIQNDFLTDKDKSLADIINDFKK